MSSFIKLPFTVDVSGLKLQLDENASLWDENPARRTYEGSPHKGMVDIWARYGVDVKDPSIPHVSEWYEGAASLTNVVTISDHIMGALGGESLGGVLITKLPPGGKILPHADSGWHAETYEKIHVSISAPDGSYFGFKDGEMHSKDGDVYWFRNDRLHWVENPTDSDRIVMIVCIKTNFFESLK